MERWLSILQTWLLPVGTLVVTLWTRAIVAELLVKLGKEQETRCQQCRKEFVSQPTFAQLDTRLTHVEEHL